MKDTSNCFFEIRNVLKRYNLPYKTLSVIHSTYFRVNFESKLKNTFQTRILAISAKKLKGGGANYNQE